MWAVAAQPRSGLTPMIPTPSVDSDIPGSPVVALEPDGLVDEDDGEAVGDYLAIDEQSLEVSGIIIIYLRLQVDRVAWLHMQVDPQRDVSGLSDPPTANKLPGGRGLEAWHSL